MITTKLAHFVRWRAPYLFLTSVAIFLLAVVLLADPPADGRLKVLKVGLGSGRVTTSPPLIDCGPDATCEATFPSSPDVLVTASPEPGSSFAGWEGDLDADGPSPDCTGMTNPCSLTMDTHRSVRPVFNLVTPPPDITDLSPQGLSDYIDNLDAAHQAVNTPARFIKALPAEFKLNWILMTRSESLQTGTALLPRILLPSADAESVFSIGMAEHSSYPGAHPNAIEYMKWDREQKTFRFHEIVLAEIQRMDADGDGVGVIPLRPRHVEIDDAKCPRCHSTRNVLSIIRTPTHPPGRVGTDGIPAGTVKVKNKPNWDAYDSWAGMMPFNRDRIYQGSIEAAAFRRLLNPWTWRLNPEVRRIMEQLRLQPPGTPVGSTPDFPDYRINRKSGGADDGHIHFAFDAPGPPVTTEPAPVGTDPRIDTNYSFNRRIGTGTRTPVTRGGNFITLQHSAIAPSDEGRGVHFFDLLGGSGTPFRMVGSVRPLSNLNSRRVADEINYHQWATGNFHIEVRPLALAIAKGCFDISGSTVTAPSRPDLPLNLEFFNRRNGMTIDQLLIDTRTRTESLPRRKADIQAFNLDRTGDPYLSVSPSPTPTPSPNGLLQEYLATPPTTPDALLNRIHQEVFRRPTDVTMCPGIFCPDSTVMGRIYVDREFYSNTNQVALYRYFLEPLGVSVDKWSMGVRGRSRTYAFADVFDTFENTLRHEIIINLSPRTAADPDTNPIEGLTSFECSDLLPLVSDTLRSLPGRDDAPFYTDVQRIFNKSCIECHGGLDYPPYQNHGTVLDLSEDENPPGVDDRLERSYNLVTRPRFINANPQTSFLYQRICPGADPSLPPDTPCPVPPAGLADDNEDCPYGLMPCGGPRLSHTDIATVRRWIIGSHPRTRGDPHIETVDGTPYDFQSAGEFVLLRGLGLEIQARQTPVGTAGPLGPNDHTGLTSCVSINTAAAVRAGGHRITYQPNTNGEPDPQGLQLRIDGKLSTIRSEGLDLDVSRIVQTSVPGGIQIEAPGGTAITFTPTWWPDYQVWYLDIAVEHARATEGVMGAVSQGNWLPALPDGTLLGPKPGDTHQRYIDLYDRFENAWRVTDATTLFDYAPGTSTSTFSIDSWPEESPQVCVAPPRQPGGPIARSPRSPLPLEVAQQHCRGVVGDNAKANCISDVMVTGDPVFAQGYLNGDQVERNALPAVPVLSFPEKFKLDLDPTLNFTWNRTSDLDKDPVTYRHCVWGVNDQFTFDKCIVTAGASASSPWRGGVAYAVPAAIVGLLLFLLLIWFGLRRKPARLYLLVVVILVGIGVAFYIGRARSRTSSEMVARSVSGLQSGKAYYWKVIAEDGKGGLSESETRRFQIK